jgi:PKD repeat protein
VSVGGNSQTSWRAQEIEAVKKLFIAFTSRDDSTGTAMVAAVLFDAAAAGRSSADGLTREQLIEAVNDRLEADGKPQSYSLTRLTTDLDRVSGSIAAFGEKYPHLPRVRGPTLNQRGDSIKRLWLEVELGPEPQPEPRGEGGITPGEQPGPAALTPIFAWLGDRYRQLPPDRRVEVIRKSRKGASGIIAALIILVFGCVAYKPVRNWLWLHVVVTPELALIDHSVSGVCADGHPLAYVRFSHLPSRRPLALLRNGHVLESYAAPADTLSLRDGGILANTTTVYRIGIRDAWSGKYLVSPSAVAYVPPCAPASAGPTVDAIEATPLTGDAPLAVTFTARVRDPHGDPLRYRWSFGDGETRTTDQPTITHVFRYAGQWPVSGDVANRHGGEASLNAAPDINVRHGPLPPLLSAAEEYRQYGYGDVTPAAGPVGTVFRFRAFPRRSTRGAAPVSYQWTDNKCAQRVCSSPDLATPEYSVRIDIAGQYTFGVNIRYADGQQETLPVAVVNVGYREHVRPDRTRWIEPVPPGSRDYRSIKDDARSATSSAQ